mmetsp:Transcript_6983/g.10422  ORF Transcript_6983/g.10422 Transcript_6983/m.10422 type:complete len:201 (-) Transcript_6983:673-1275(-)
MASRAKQARFTDSSRVRAISTSALAVLTDPSSRASKMLFTTASDAPNCPQSISNSLAMQLSAPRVCSLARAFSDEFLNIENIFVMAVFDTPVSPSIMQGTRQATRSNMLSSFIVKSKVSTKPLSSIQARCLIPSSFSCKGTPSACARYLSSVSLSRKSSLVGTKKPGKFKSSNRVRVSASMSSGAVQIRRNWGFFKSLKS